MQGIGYVDDLRGRRRGWYFRARCDEWSLEVYGGYPFPVDGTGMEILFDMAEWEAWGTYEDASWMPIDVAHDLVERGLKAWRSR